MTIGNKITHEKYGEGVISEVRLASIKAVFKTGGELEFSKTSDAYELLEPASEQDSNQGVSIEDLESLIINAIEKYNGPQQPVALGEKWLGGTLFLQPEDKDLKPKEIPVETFFHKIVMLRDRLRVLEQNINSHEKLNPEEKVNLQQYITRCYGSLTTFNVLFRDKENYFKGAGK